MWLVATTSGKQYEWRVGDRGVGVTDSDMAALVIRAAEREGVDASLLQALLELEQEFPDLTVPGERTRLGRRVTELLNAAAVAAGEKKVAP